MRALLGSRLLWAVMAAAFLWSSGRIAARMLARDPRFLARPDRVRMAAPSWGGPEVVAPLERALRALGPVNLFHPRFEESVRAAVEACPEVAGTGAVERVWPDRYAVEVILRRPVAVVVSGSRELPVTGNAIVLPTGPYTRAARDLVRIVGVPERPPGPGCVWDSEALRDGLATVAQLAPHVREVVRLGLRVIDVSRAHDSLEGVNLRGRDDLVVRWGRPRARAGENTVARKLEYLRATADHAASVRGVELDFRFDRIFVR